MEPDGHGEELPAPTGVTINLNPERVIARLQNRSAELVQDLQWKLATRDAVVEVLEEKLNETEQLREEAEGALTQVSNEKYVVDALLADAQQDLAEAREQIAKLTKGEQDLLHKIETLTSQLSETREDRSRAQRDAFLEAPLAGRLELPGGDAAVPAAP